MVRVDSRERAAAERQLELYELLVAAMDRRNEVFDIVDSSEDANEAQERIRALFEVRTHTSAERSWTSRCRGGPVPTAGGSLTTPRTSVDCWQSTASRNHRRSSPAQQPAASVRRRPGQREAGPAAGGRKRVPPTNRHERTPEESLGQMRSLVHLEHHGRWSRARARPGPAGRSMHFVRFRCHAASGRTRG